MSEKPTEWAGVGGARGALRIGLIVNPISGMGGSVGLHGTDGRDILAAAKARGAVAAAPSRARRALSTVAARCPGTTIVAPPGAMGMDSIADLSLHSVQLSGEEPAETSMRDTQAAAAALRAEGVSAILFAGGDGTARDIAAVVGLDVPILGIPSGVKMQSGVFGTSPEAAGQLVVELLMGDQRVGFRKVEIMDIDEEARRAGRLGARLYGYVRAPYLRSLLQAAKAAPALTDDAALAAACGEAARELSGDVTWLIGPGTTAKMVGAAFGDVGHLLGVDAVRDGQIVGRDLSETEVLAIAGDMPIGIVVGITGGQGFVFGRGNQQIGAAAIRRAWPDRLIMLASEAKLAALPEPCLHVDTGDPDLDAAIAGWARVRTGPKRVTLMRLSA